jgi:branched-subunit amino acid transport protein
VSSPRSEFLAGIRAELPLLLGVTPFGLIYGTLALQAGIPAAPALAMSSIVLAGSAQFVATQLFSAGDPAAVILPAGTLDLSAGNERLLAATLAGLVAWRANNALLTIGLGMAALWILQWVRP